MKNLPVYENLDTSFVNLAALVRFLRARHFVGNLRVELDAYEARLDFDGENFKTHEHDRRAGRIAEGDEAFERLLIRARAHGGTISVFQASSQTITEEQPATALGERQASQIIHYEAVEKTPMPKPTFFAPLSTEDFASPKIAHVESKAADKKSSPPPEKLNASNNHEILPPLVLKTLDPQDFEFTNHVEELARQKQISPEDWQTLLNLVAELLATIDRSLARANLDFSSAFVKARTEIANDYPFLNPAAGAFDYRNGRLTISEPVSAKIFAAGIGEALRRIFDKLAANPKFAQVYQDAAHSIRALAAERQLLYDKFFIMPQLEKNVVIKNILAA